MWTRRWRQQLLQKFLPQPQYSEETSGTQKSLPHIYVKENRQEISMTLFKTKKKKNHVRVCKHVCCFTSEKVTSPGMMKAQLEATAGSLYNSGLHEEPECTDLSQKRSSWGAAWCFGCGTDWSSAPSSGPVSSTPGQWWPRAERSGQCLVMRRRWPTCLPAPASERASPRWGPVGPTSRRCSGWWDAGSQSLLASVQRGPPMAAGRTWGGAEPWSGPSSSASPSHWRSPSACCGSGWLGPSCENAVRSWGPVSEPSWEPCWWMAAAAGRTERGWSPWSGPGRASPERRGWTGPSRSTTGTAGCSWAKGLMRYPWCWLRKELKAVTAAWLCCVAFYMSRPGCRGVTSHLCRFSQTITV